MISLDLSSMASWPSTRRWRVAQAETRCSGSRPLRRAWVAPRGLAVDGDDVGLIARATSRPSCEAGLEQLGIEPVDHVVERVVSRDAVLIGQEPPQEIEPLFAPQADLHKILHAAKRGAKHQQQDLRQRIQNPPALPRVRQRREMIDQAGRAGFAHQGLRFVGAS